MVKSHLRLVDQIYSFNLLIRKFWFIYEILTVGDDSCFVYQEKLSQHRLFTII